MTDYSELVKALRYCAESGDFKCGKEWGIVKKMRFYRKAIKWLWKHRAEDNNRHKWRRMMREV